MFAASELLVVMRHRKTARASAWRSLAPSILCIACSPIPENQSDQPADHAGQAQHCPLYVNARRPEIDFDLVPARRRREPDHVKERVALHALPINLDV